MSAVAQDDFSYYLVSTDNGYFISYEFLAIAGGTIPE
jgi:hypothetical protein